MTLSYQNSRRIAPVLLDNSSINVYRKTVNKTYFSKFTK